MTAETMAEAPWPDGSDFLQWSRGLLTAETQQFDIEFSVTLEPSMEPRSFDRGDPVFPATRKYFGNLQWSRGLLTAETQPGPVLFISAESAFNGAAVF